MFTHKKYRKNPELIARAKVLLSIMIAYVAGAVFSGLTYYYLEFRVFYVISLCLLVVIGYDAYKIHLRHFNTRYRYSRIYRKPTMLAYLYDKIHGIPKERKTKIHFRRLNILLVLILCKTSCEPSSICVNI
jgi:hypothetical protein